MNTEQISVIKADGTREPFDVSKLKESLLHSGASEKITNDVIAHLSGDLRDGMKTSEIYKHAFDILRREEEPVAMKYSIRHAVMELGPSGFPFEKYVAEIFKAKGFETLTDQTVKGFCVEHEIDVVAWNAEKLIMVEAKFHNELGTKSDLKVVLYVKARFDDLRKMKFSYGGKERDLDEAWLVTNSKFSSTAIEYASCQGGLMLVGWNYPPVGNLHDMIVDAKLHPITCLVSLNSSQKKALLEKGIVLCKTILENRDVLEMAHVDEETRKKVIAEIEAL